MQDQCGAPNTDLCEPTRFEVAAPTPPLPSLPIPVAPSPRPVAPKHATSNAPHPATNGGTRLVAPIPGVVTIFEKCPGDEVQRGDIVMILEAMKMENLITSPVPGKVVSIHCKEGERVSKGTLLALIG